ncbi:type IV pilus twitching motility protein PilT [Anaerorhabdus sp.]|uniref:type IV pilus twitching motility protein PilT n=1 Tax=Anaerorhabdus sp. TaxID=1872524 RepID=UPI002FCC5A39
MIEEYLQFARQNNASDLHITVGLPAMLRVTGNLKPVNDVPLSENEVLVLVKSMISDAQFNKLMTGDDLDFTYVSREGYRNRVNIYRQKGSFAIALRLLNSSIPTLESLELPEILGKLAMLQRGLILVTGPTGSGKSTTLAAMIDVINRNRRCHILTLEEPVEYVHSHKSSMINQREIGTDSYSFAHALRSALREDPDVILVGEMRDFETISLALTAAETGHLVLSTLHTTSVAQTIDRIIDVFPPNQQNQIRLQLSVCLKAVVAQHLLPKIDNRSRCAALEIVVTNEAVGNMIREGKTYHIPSVMQTHPGDGMQTIEMSLARLVRENKISMEVAMEHCSDSQLLRRLVNSII